jgi:hypothetical protein
MRRLSNTPLAAIRKTRLGLEPLTSLATQAFDEELNGLRQGLRGRRKSDDLRSSCICHFTVGIHQALKER